ncbi:DUF3822 family protein [Mucilaginibacter achroorhodeus]|uniref:DUF3822 family protein n=1 Tax=Mucilaginibacter achroorhodeus TaxID=2599294 RepID=A0A563U1C6_9SPHI|nr:DUF3822 family protein [Mucilaginibacter achroorhodeus]TWR25418.1 DUF3822 family protein [Mucilaginibacter achroorhodeus]
MSENKTLYTSNDLSLNQAHSYTLLLQVEVNSFSYAIVHGKQLLAWGENFNTDELRDPDQLRDILTANYKEVLIGLDAEAATLLPKSLYEPGRVNEIARLLDVKDNEKVFSQLLDDDNVIIYKADETLTYAVKDLDNQYVFHKDAGFIKAIPNDYPTSSNLYLNIGHDKVSIVNYKYNKLRFNNTFSIKNHEELAYFCALVAKELQLEPKDMRLVLSGEINDTDGYFNYLKDFFGQVRLSSITILDAPYDIQSHKLLAIAALLLCV